MLRYGTTLGRDGDGRLLRVTDRTGHVHAALTWQDDALLALDVGVTVAGAILHDPLLGDVHRVGATTMSALDWRRPNRIPAIAAPGKLPPFTGAALMNTLALLADRPLRYAAPYPTPALFRALLRSFRTTGTEAAFCAGVLDRATRVAMDEIPIDFAPAPHERVAHAHGFVELRDGLERAVLDGVSFDAGIARLVAGHAEIWFGDAPYARVASFAPDGALVDGPHPIPPCTSSALGKPFPPALCGALAQLVGEVAPAPLAHDVAALVATTPMVWADLGARAARFAGDRLEVHAALWERIAPHGLGRLALALAEALAPVATSAVLARL